MGSQKFSETDMGIVLNHCQYGVLYLGSYYNTGPYIRFPHFGNSNLRKIPHTKRFGEALQVTSEA